MKIRILSALAALSLLAVASSHAASSVAEEADVHRFATFNVRYFNPSNGDTGEKSWDIRKSYVGRIVTDYDFDIVGMQEVTGNVRDESGKTQLDGLREMLPAYTSWAVERSGRQYEYNVLFFKTARYELIEKGYFYLNEHPDTPGAGWSTSASTLPRVLAWAHLRDKSTATDFFFAVTHVNYGATVSGIESCRLIGRRLHEICGNAPAVLVGDFNMRRNEHSDAWRGVARYFSDAALCTPTSCLPEGNISHTASNWLTADNPDCKGSEFDYVFFKRMIPLTRNIITEDYGRDVTPSDHFPLLVRFRFPQEGAQMLQPDSCGVYRLATAADLQHFSALVQSGNVGAEAELTADVDMSSVGADWQPIGTSQKPFVGRFDGCGHVISGFSRTTTANADGLFGYIRGATVENFTLKGRLIVQHARCGVVGHCTNAEISNVHSVLSVDARHPSASHTGGVVGYALDKTLVDRCSFSGSLTVGTTNYDCFGGVCAYTNTACFTNCANYGTVSFAKDDCYAGGVVGYVNNGSFPGLHNCLNVGRVRYNGSGSAVYGGALVGWLRSYNANLMGENYWLSSTASAGGGENTDDGFHRVSLSQLRSGEVCCLLNDSCDTCVWYQNIGQDAYPVLDATHRSVVRLDDGTFANPDGVETVRQTSDATTCQHIYDLFGRQLPPGRRPKGVYVRKGRKVLY